MPDFTFTQTSFYLFHFKVEAFLDAICVVFVRQHRFACAEMSDVSVSSLRVLQGEDPLQHRGATYFSGAFVFDGELALLFAVIDVAQLVVKQIRGRRRRREPRKKHREQGREAAHPAAEPERSVWKPLERSGESSFKQH